MFGRIKWFQQIKKEKELNINEWWMSCDSEHVYMHNKNTQMDVMLPEKSGKLCPGQASWPLMSEEHVI